ncbi:guanine deaminase [Panus rudis PR-1116 ss-1]|nr:guanine deaminase [Panus rudis PR-1116 ss-1]
MPIVFYGGLVTPVSLTSYKALPHALLAVSRETGIIDWVEDDVPAHTLQEVLAKHGLCQDPETDLVELKAGEFIMPGLIDTHTHAPQVPNIGSGQQHELLDWLAEVTFPMEARFKDPVFARETYTTVVRRIVDCGTTTCCYYGTLHLGGTKILADIVHASGQRAFVGKCNMDRHSPEYYVEPSPEVSVAATRELISYIRSLTRDHKSALVQPIVTPRFAISCTPELLSSLGDLVKSDPSLAIQTHISENESEIKFTKSLFPPSVLPKEAKVERTTYAGVYDAYRLLRENTILAHAVHLEDDEIELIRKRKTGISHCPTSNFNLRSGCAKVGMLLDKGIKVGLGTDVSGGFSPSILTAIQHASMCSKVVALMDPLSQTAPVGFTSRQLPVPTLLYLATLGGASLCNLEDKIGSITPGKSFDALLVSVRSDAGNPAIWGADWDERVGVRGSGGEPGDEGGRGKSDTEELEGLLERFLFCGDDRNIRRVYVQGKVIGGKEYR